ncbi:hypothetical protein [Carboxylicivirga sp. RSCT41]|uniref:hypothetical protein n=1 Tax=Carboxylicivirga agarovorans TaxID=3417570 RepID=UPI003D332109
MKAVKSLLVIALFLIGGVIVAQPQGGQGGRQQGPPPIPNAKQIQKMVSDLSEQASLSDDQEEAIYELYTKHFEEVEEKLKGNSRPPRDEMEKLKSELETAVKAELDKEQIEQYEAWKKTQKKKRAQRQKR